MKLFDSSRLEIRDLFNPTTIKRGEYEVFGSFPQAKTTQGNYSNLPLLHATTAERALSIIEEGYICSHQTLSERGASFLADTRFINTDELDKILGLDRFVFLSLGRMAPRIFELSDDIVIFMIDPRSINSMPGVFYSLREICEFGATVSQEGANVLLQAGGQEEFILDQNIKATTEFYNSLISNEKFGEFFDRFTHGFGVNILEYLRRMTYPGENEEIVIQNGLRILQNYWQGFQCMIPNKLEITSSAKILCTSSQTRESILKIMPSFEVTTTDYLIKQFPEDSNILMNEQTISIFSAMLHNKQLRSQ